MTVIGMYVCAMLAAGAGAEASPPEPASLAAPAAAEQPAPPTEADRTVRNAKVVCDGWPDGSSLRQFALDAIALSGAETEEEQALACLQWMRRWTMFTNGTAPQERGQSVLDDLKILNVYGAHWCDGRALLMENLWRSIGGRAYKLYIPDGFTLALVNWTDADGQARWHQIHASRGWYVYNRQGCFVATPDEIAADFSLMFRPSRTGIPRSGHPPRPWNWLAVGHRPFSQHDMTLVLRPGETYSRLWGNEGIPACDNVGETQYDDGEHGPYPITYGNGRLVSVLDPVNVAHPPSGVIDSPPGAGAPQEEGDRTVLVHPVRLPHVVADAWLEGDLPAGTTVQMSGDGATYFEPLPVEGNRVELGRNCAAPRTVVGRYQYWLKVSWPAAEKLAASPVLTTVVQHNLFSLPQLQPGRNLVTVSAGSPASLAQAGLPPGVALRVTYEWDDAAAKGKRHVAVMERSPFTYTIPAAGRQWSDVRCTKLTIEAFRAGGGGNRVEVAAPDAPAQPRRMPPMNDIVGDKKPAALKSAAEYVRDLADPAKRRDALDGLMVLCDPSAGPALIDLLYSAEEMPLQERGRVCQAIYHCLDRKAAFDALLPVVAGDPKVKWLTPPDSHPAVLEAGRAGGAGPGGETAEGTEGARRGGPPAARSAGASAEGARSVASLVAHLAGMADYQPALPVLVAAFDRGVGQWNRTAYLRAFGRLKAREAVPLCVRTLREHSDFSTSAAWALGQIGDPSVVPDLLRAIERRRATRTQGIFVAEGARTLGVLKAQSPEAVALLQELLAHQDEEVRGAAAEALGVVGWNEHAALLKAAGARETYPWVKTLMLASAASVETKDAPGKALAGPRSGGPGG